MTITLQALPRGTEYLPVLVAAGTTQTPAWGGPSIPIERTGDRWAWDVAAPNVDGPCGAALSADLTRGRLTPVVMSVTEPGLPIRDYGAPLVDGAGQQGTTLALKGLPPGVVIAKGKWLSIVQAGGQRFLYQVAAEATADGDGEAGVPILPMIRRSPPNNAVVELAAPKVEGTVTFEGAARRAFASIGLTTGLRFRLTEQE